MEINLILTAQTWQLAGAIESSEKHGGVLMVKNAPEHTYLCLTPKQWQVLLKFNQPRTVPQVLEVIIEERLCPALGEYYELILKAVRARILIEGAPENDMTAAVNWPVSLRPARWRWFFWGLFAAGLGATAYFRPLLPGTWYEAVLGGAVWLLSAMAGAAVSASLLRGAGGEIYLRQGWLLDRKDACMFSPSVQRTIAIAPLALLSAATALLAWRHPSWSFVPLFGLLLRLRPVLGGTINALIRVGAERRLSDAEHAFLFPMNRSARQRWKMLRESLRMPTTWMEIGYAVFWTIVFGYFLGGLAETPPWRLAFWESNGIRLGLALAGSLLLLILGYLAWEFSLFARERALARHETFRQFRRRWFGRASIATNENARQRALLRSPLLRQLPPPVQQALARALRPETRGPWRVLHDFDAPIDRVSFILSGKVGVYRRNRAGRRVLIQVLCENDLVGLHAIGDPNRPEFIYRSLTPVLLLRVEAALARELIVARFPAGVIANLVQKMPFLSRISLCQNWHLQSIQRLSEITRVVDYQDGEVILQQGFYSESFYIVFEGQARVMVKGSQVGAIAASNFFGEIGLLQNSSATAQVVAGPGTRCLCVPRQEFLRFVAHNYTVALKLERVSSQRLGHPIFPLTPGNFRQI